MVDVGAVVNFGNPSTSSGSEAFENASGVATDPTAVTLLVTKPNGVNLNYGWPSAGANGTLTRESAGRFYFAVTIDQTGLWRFQETGTGAVAAFATGSVNVPGSALSGTTLGQTINTLADEMGGYASFTTTTAGSNIRTVTSTEMADEQYGATNYDQGYLYAIDGPLMGQQKRVKDIGFAGTGGSLTATSDWSMIPPAGSAFEWLSPLPRVRYGRVLGLREIVHQALRRIWIRDELHLIGEAGVYAYSLDPYWWFRDKKRLLGVKDPLYGAYGVPQRTSRAVAYRYDAEGPVLEVAGGWDWQTGDDVAVMVVRPANSRLRLHATATATVSAGAVNAVAVKTQGDGYTSVPVVTASGGGGSGATFTATVTYGKVTSIAITAAGTLYTSPPHLTISPPQQWVEQANPNAGPMADADETHCPLTLVVTVAKALAYRQLALTAPGQYAEYYRTLAVEWAAIAGALKEHESPANDGDLPPLLPGRGGAIWGSKGLWP